MRQKIQVFARQNAKILQIPHYSTPIVRDLSLARPSDRTRLRAMGDSHAPRRTGQAEESLYVTPFPKQNLPDNQTRPQFLQCFRAWERYFRFSTRRMCFRGFWLCDKKRTRLNRNTLPTLRFVPKIQDIFGNSILRIALLSPTKNRWNIRKNRQSATSCSR